MEDNSPLEDSSSHNQPPQSAQVKQQRVDSENDIVHIHAQHITQLQQLTAKHTAALSEAVSAAQAELCQQQLVHEQALVHLKNEMYCEAEQQVAANCYATLQSWEEEKMWQLEQLQLSLSDEHMAATEALMVEGEHFRLEGIFAFESKLQHGLSTIEALELELKEQRCLVEQLRTQLSAKVCHYQCLAVVFRVMTPHMLFVYQRWVSACSVGHCMCNLSLSPQDKEPQQCVQMTDAGGTLLHLSLSLSTLQETHLMTERYYLLSLLWECTSTLQTISAGNHKIHCRQAWTYCI